MSPDEVLELYLRTTGAYGLVFVLGALFGSFANVCIYRMPPTDEHPKGRSIARPGSHCSACKKPVRWYDNVPLLSYLWLRGRCRDCGAEFSPRYLLVEGATAMLFVAVYHLVVGLVYVADPVPLKLLRFGIMAGFVFVMVVVAFIDLDHKLILNRITYPAIPIFYLLGMLLPEQDWSTGLIGAAVGYGIVRLMSDGLYWITKREYMGYGDGKLLAIIGALLGWKGVVFALFGGSLVGSAVSIPLLVWARWRAAPAVDGDEEEGVSLRHVEVPFGPFLAVGAVAYLFLASWVEVTFGVLYWT